MTFARAVSSSETPRSAAPLEHHTRRALLAGLMGAGLQQKCHSVLPPLVSLPSERLSQGLQRGNRYV